MNTKTDWFTSGSEYLDRIRIRIRVNHIKKDPQLEVTGADAAAAVSDDGSDNDDDDDGDEHYHDATDDNNRYISNSRE